MGQLRHVRQKHAAKTVRFAAYSLPMHHEHINVKELFRQVTRIPRKVGMSQALDILGYPLQGTHHRGGDDAFNIARILRYCLNHSEAAIE